MSTREMIAYGIIVVLAAVMIPATITLMTKRRREKLRRRGIKDYNRDAASLATPRQH